ncbi:oligosaccharide flippase family protein [Leptolyngbya sp. GB1-A1]|uniref:oligosaccharide flippase family protein n=1 Tax=Leptolyngbya sp. GB1-A1 TaxID=2933908 RepID=UPI00329899DE
MNMSKVSAAKVVGGSFWVTGGFVFIRASQLLTQIVLARLLSPAEFGIWAMVLLVTTLSNLFKDWAIAGVLVYKGLDDRKLVNAVYSLGVNVSIGMGILQAVSGIALARFFNVPVLLPLTVCVSLVFLIGAGAGSHAAVMQRQMRFKDLALCDAAAAFARCAGALACAGLGGGVWAFAIGELSMATVDSVMKRWSSRYTFQYHLFPDTAALSEVKNYISGIIGSNLAVYTNTNSDNLVIGRLLGAEKLGYYNLAYQLAMLPVFALTQINRVNFSVLTQKNHAEKKIYAGHALRFYGVISAPIYGVAFLVAPWLLPITFGAQWTEAAKIFQLILIFAYARGFMSILGAVLDSLNKTRTNAMINWALVLVSVPSYLAGALVGGIAGVAIAVALVMGILATLWFLLVICRSAKYEIRFLAKPILLPTFMILIAMAIVLSIPIINPWQIYLQPFALIVLYAGGSIILFPKEIAQIISPIKELLKTRGGES